ASNSLLEAAVFAARAARAIEAELVDVTDPAATAPICVDPALPRRMSLSRQKDLPRTGLSRPELRDLTWAHLGVERRAAGLRLLLDRLGEDPAPDERHESLAEAVETANLALIAEHMARHALAREHSLGAHTRTDTPDPSTVATGGTTTDLLQEATAC
ncbi:MAG TPA: L-aspartate oxidase, partial [Candidatus Brevibacterium intestinavium]|nr:L-aspartate oxidase [Candidatus Brevibacterium intestinavium]